MSHAIEPLNDVSPDWIALVLDLGYRAPRLNVNSTVRAGIRASRIGISEILHVLLGE
jgi:hypothetical protein